MSEKIDQLVKECHRQSESCLYVSTSLFIWLRILRNVRVVFIVAPLGLGSLASGKLLLAVDPNGAKAFAAVCAFLAGLLPSIYAALKYEERLKECVSLSAEFKNLQDRFRQAALIAAQTPSAEFEAQFEELMCRLEQARRSSYTAPEWCFKLAQKKISRGDYGFTVDSKSYEPKP